MSVEIGSLDFLFTYPIRNLPVKAKIKSLDVGFENDNKSMWPKRFVHSETECLYYFFIKLKKLAN